MPGSGRIRTGAGGRGDDGQVLLSLLATRELVGIFPPLFGAVRRQMLRFLARRLLAMVPLLLIVSVIVFGLVLLIPGDPAVTIAGDNPTEEQVAQIRENLGLNDPLIAQFGGWLQDAVRLDFGQSLLTRQPVLDTLVARLPVTLSLTFGAVLVSLIIAVPLGIAAARHRGRWIDRVAMLGATAGVAMPNFWLAAILVSVFVINLGWFPAIGYVPFTEDPVLWVKHLTLPALALGVAGAAELARQLRGALIDVLDQDYVRTARAKGLHEIVVVGKHTMKNALVPVLTVLGMQISHLLGGAIIIESIFGMPGLGSLAIQSVLSRDLPVIQGIVVLFTLVIVGANLLVDMSYGYVNPKVREA